MAPIQEEQFSRKASDSNTGKMVRAVTASVPARMNELDYVKMEDDKQESCLPKRVSMCIGKVKATIPLFDWLPKYSLRDDLLSDVTGGTGVGLVCLAQTLAHAAIATTLPIQGPYCAFVPAIAYGIMGTSPHASVSSGAIAALIIADQLKPWDDPVVRTQLASLLALFTGISLLLMGACNMAFLMRFLSRPTLGGFITGGSIIICLEQLKNMLGYATLPEYPDLPPPLAVAKGLIVQLPQAEISSIILGLFLLAILESCNRLKKWANAKIKQNPKMAYVKRFTEMKEIIATIIGVSVGYFTSEVQSDGTRKPIMLVVGEIPSGLPSFQLPWDIPAFWNDLYPDSQALTRFIVGSFLVSLSSFLTTYATAKKMALKFGYPLDASQEMIGLGSAGIAGSFFQAFPPSGSLSRTGLAADCGVRTQMGGFVCAAVIGLGLQFLTPALYFMPKATLAAIIITSTRSLIDFATPMELWKYWKPSQLGGLKTDLVVWTVAFIITSMIGVIQGILAAVLVSVSMIIADAAKPEAHVLGRIESMNKWRSMDEWQGFATSYPGIMVYEFRGPLLFVSAEFFQEQIEDYRMKYSTKKTPINIIILSFSSVHRLDISALTMLEDILSEWKQRGIRCIVTGAKAQTRRLIEGRMGLDGKGLLEQTHYLIGVNDAFNLAIDWQNEAKTQDEKKAFATEKAMHQGALKIQNHLRRLSSSKRKLKQVTSVDKLQAEIAAHRSRMFERESKKPVRRISAPSGAF